MQNTTMDAVTAILRSDASLADADRKMLVGLIRGDRGIGGPNPTDRILRRREVAQLLGRSVKAVDRLSERGVLKRVIFPTCTKAAGFRLSDVARLVAGTGGSAD